MFGRSFTVWVAAVAFIVTAAVAHTAVLLAQKPAVRWSVIDEDISPTDQKQILELADRVGVHDVRLVSEELTRLPLGCFALLAQSEVTVAGNRRTWTEAFIDRIDPTGGQDELGKFCHAASAHPTRIGRWEVDPGQVFHREVWSVADGDWSYDVILGDGVPYETAAKIILAIKRKTFVDQHKPVDQPFGNELLIGGPALLSQVGSHYELRMGSGGGLLLRIAIDGERVVLLSVDSWIS
jgi:hypothetical protein